MTEEALPPVEEEVPVEEPTVPEEPVEEPPPVIPPKSEYILANRIEFEIWIPTDIYQTNRQGFEAIAKDRFEEHYGIPAAGVTAITRQTAQPGFENVTNFSVLTIYAYAHGFLVKEAGA